MLYILLPEYLCIFSSALLSLASTSLFAQVTHADFKKAKEKVMFKKQEGVPEGLYM